MQQSRFHSTAKRVKKFKDSGGTFFQDLMKSAFLKFHGLQLTQETKPLLSWPQQSGDTGRVHKLYLVPLLLGQKGGTGATMAICS